VAAFGMALRDSPYKGTATVKSAADLVSTSLGFDPNGRRAEFLALIRKAEGLK
jgi:Ca-activated chloride channel homolog